MGHVRDVSLFLSLVYVSSLKCHSPVSLSHDRASLIIVSILHGLSSSACMFGFLANYSCGPLINEFEIGLALSLAGLATLTSSPHEAGYDS
jgi:hypothetical protein